MDDRAFAVLERTSSGATWQQLGTHGNTWELRGYAGSNTRLDLLVPEGLWGIIVDPCGNFI